MTCDYCDDLDANTELVLDLPVQACDHCTSLALIGIFPKSEEHRQRRLYDCLFCGKWTSSQPFKLYHDDRLGSFCARRACLDAFDELDEARDRMRSVGLR